MYALLRSELHYVRSILRHHNKGYLASAVACMRWEGAGYGMVGRWLSAALEMGSFALLRAWLPSACW